MRRILTIGKLSKKFLLGLLTAVLLICPATAIETIHTEQTGSLTIKSSYGGQPLTNVPFAVYRMADVSQYGSFTLLPQYTGSKAAVNQLTQDAAIDWRKAAQHLRTWTQNHAISADAQKNTDKNGTVTFSQLRAGLYLVVGLDAKSNGKTYCSAPFLVSVPELTENQTAWQYDVTANPKSEPEHTTQPEDKPKDDTPPKKPKKNLPDTGILQWPIPVLAGSGLALMLIGWKMKKNNRNK